ncbi:hypothetical protein EYZ11_007970 [Aspergillus tanneri]|uniref:CRAL-TRIO domain-containing protein n=1 Tax=Aspergillus tanneri TaxID=1220188 RepID=A0A4S3JBN0_9EURO|nr:hypothetical protein EYZ11_007970 [Aspergillus tanneri]
MTVDNAAGFDLDQGQRLALETFTQLCKDQSLLDHPDGLAEQDARDAINDETTLVRFLRARKFDPDGAFEQFREACRFRKENHIHEVYDGIRLEDFETARRVYPHWTGRRDKRGLPICIANFINITGDTVTGWKGTRYLQGTSSELRQVDILQLGSVIFDSITRFAFPLCSAVAGKPITRAVILVDASTLSLKQGFDLRLFARDISGLLTTCFPETIERIFLCNCPSYFAAIWKILKGWVDPVTAEKLVFLTPVEVLPTLKEYIDPENLPVSLGGKLDFEHGMQYDLDAAVRKVLGRDQLVPGPMKWVYDNRGRMSAVAVGSVDGQKRQATVATLE